MTANLWTVCLAMALTACCQDNQASAGQRKEVAGKKEAVYQGKPTSFWIEQLKDKSVDFRQQAARALGEIGPEAGAAVPALIEALKDKYWAVRQAAAGALGEIGSAAESAVLPLIKTYKDLNEATHPEVIQEAILDALEKIDAEAAQALRNFSKPRQAEEKVKVLAAKQAIPIGTLIKEPEKLFDWKSFTKGEVPRKAILDMDRLKGQVLNKTLSAEQFVTPDDLTDKEQPGIVRNLPKGMRAVAIKVGAESGSFILPNSRVDVISTRNEAEGKVSQIILQNLLVLAVDGGPAPRDADKQAVLPTTVTLAATPEDCQKLILAANLGELRLVLRNFEDK